MALLTFLMSYVQYAYGFIFNIWKSSIRFRGLINFKLRIKQYFTIATATVTAVKNVKLIRKEI